MNESVRTFTYDPLPYAPVVPAMLADLVSAYGDNDFVVSSAGDGRRERITYARSDVGSAEMARRLVAAGVTKGVRVGILAPNGPDFVIAFLAVTRIGAVAVPINTFFQPRELGGCSATQTSTPCCRSTHCSARTCSRGSPEPPEISLSRIGC